MTICIRGGSRIFFRMGCTRLLVYFNTNKPHSFFFGRIPVVLETAGHLKGGGVRTPCTLPLDPPPVHVIYSQLYSNRLILYSTFKVVLRDIARFHSIHLGDVASLTSESWMCVISGSVIKSLKGFWRALLRNSHMTFPVIWTQNRWLKKAVSIP